MIGFILGLLAGGFIGVFAVAMYVVAGEDRS